MQPTDFKTSNYFTGMPYVLGYILLPVGALLLFSGKFVISTILILAGIGILFTHYRISIDTAKRQGCEYIFLLGLRMGKENFVFESIQYIFIKSITVTQTLNSRASSTSIKKQQHEGYLKFSDQHTIHLITHDSKNRLLKKLEPIRAMLNVRIIDYSNKTATT